jgi:Domain of unknown function (DUF932)
MIKGIEAVRSNLIHAKKIQLHTGMEGFDSPESYGIYRNTGGAPLGVVGRVYEPPDLDLLLMAVEQSVEACGAGIDISGIEYAELKGGSKVRISIPGFKQEIKSPMVGDVFNTRLDFMTGFDGLTKTTLSFFALRLWCTNGASNWQKAIDLSFKNTPGNQGKWTMFCDEIFKVLAHTRDYALWLGAISKKTYTKAERDAFFTKLLGYNESEYKELTTRKRNILDKINAACAIEEQNTGSNLFGLVQGVTRYTSHELAGGNMDLLLTDNAAELNKLAHQAAQAVFAN